MPFSTVRHSLSQPTVAYYRKRSTLQVASSIRDRVRRRHVCAALAAALLLSMVGSEWLHPYVGINRAKIALRTIPALIVGVVALAVFYRLRAPGIWTRMWIVLLLPTLIGLLHLVSGPVDITDPLVHTLASGLALAIPASIVAIWLAADPPVLVWAFEKAARFLALLSVYSFITNLFPQMVGGYLVPGWPVRLLILFGFAWHLHRWLESAHRAPARLLFLCCSSLDLFFSLHKPIIVASLACCGYLVWVARGTSSFAEKCSRIGMPAILALIGVLIANAVSAGRVAEYAESVVRHKYFHGALDEGGTLGDVVTRASGGRLDALWIEAVNRIRERPLFGHGFAVLLDFDAAYEENHVHNGYLDLILSLGLAGALPLLLALLSWLRRASRARLHLDIVRPCTAFVVAVMAYNLGGTSRLFVTVTGISIFLVVTLACLRLQPQRSDREDCSLHRAPKHRANPPPFLQAPAVRP